ncbi:MAG: GreA/GreB family elongation factor [Candidatus Kerfeldbacteria bacterium]|nr:GreA/GreB family elongation factor [Candidatus Kerfeldbacteria bacterium]
MRLPNRKPGKYTFPTFDPNITDEQLQLLQRKLNHIKQISLPQAIKDTQRYGEHGDYSENAEYQIAKGHLRGLLRTIDELHYQINHAVIIQPPTDVGAVHIGHTVTVASNGQTTQFKILGSTEAKPAAGIISYQSPVGAALLGHQLNDIVTVQLGHRQVQYTILKID